MLAELKKRYWGQEIFSVPVTSKKKSSVYIWDRNGHLTLNIKSKNFWYVQGPGRNDATLTFEAEATGSLLDAIARVQSKIHELTGKGI